MICGLLVALLATGVRAAGAPPKIEDIFKSIAAPQASDGIAIAWGPLLIGVVAVALMVVAVTHWKRLRAAPASRTLNNHRKLIREVNRSAGLPTRQLKRLTPLAQSQGLSSPLVALICPSAIKKLAENVRTAEQAEALRSIARQLIKHEARGK